MKDKLITLSFTIFALGGLTAVASLVAAIPHFNGSEASLGVVAGAFAYKPLRKLIRDKFEYKFLGRK